MSDPFASYRAKYGGGASTAPPADPFASYKAKYEKPEESVVGSVLDTGWEWTKAAARGLDSGVNSLVGIVAPEVARRHAEKRRGLLGEADTTGEKIVEGGSRVAFELAAAAGTGGAVGAGAKAALKHGIVQSGTRLGSIAAATAAPATRGGRMVRNLTTGAPIDVLQGLKTPEESTLQLVGELSGSEALVDAAQNPLARIGTEVATGFGLGTAIEEAIHGVRAGRRAAQANEVGHMDAFDNALQKQPQYQEQFRPANSGQWPEVDPLSARAAGTRRANQVAAAYEAPQGPHSLEIPREPAPGGLILPGQGPRPLGPLVEPGGNVVSGRPVRDESLDPLSAYGIAEGRLRMGDAAELELERLGNQAEGRAVREQEHLAELAARDRGLALGVEPQRLLLPEEPRRNPLELLDQPPQLGPMVAPVDGYRARPELEPAAPPQPAHTPAQAAYLERLRQAEAQRAEAAEVDLQRRKAALAGEEPPSGRIVLPGESSAAGRLILPGEQAPPQLGPMVKPEGLREAVDAPPAATELEPRPAPSRPMVLIGGESKAGTQTANDLKGEGWGRMQVEMPHGDLQPHQGEKWAIDNGAYRQWSEARDAMGLGDYEMIQLGNPGAEYDFSTFYRNYTDALRASREGGQAPQFAVIPDEVGNADATLRRAGEFLYDLNYNRHHVLTEEAGGMLDEDPYAFAHNFRASHVPLYLPIQPGMTPEAIERALWDNEAGRSFLEDVGGILLGGSKEWKYAEAKQWADWAKSHGMKAHWGRANALTDLQAAKAAGFDSVDSAWYNAQPPKRREHTERVRQWDENPPSWEDVQPAIQRNVKRRETLRQKEQAAGRFDPQEFEHYRRYSELTEARMQLKDARVRRGTPEWEKRAARDAEMAAEQAAIAEGPLQAWFRTKPGERPDYHAMLPSPNRADSKAPAAADELDELMPRGGGFSGDFLEGLDDVPTKPAKVKTPRDPEYKFADPRQGAAPVRYRQALSVAEGLDDDTLRRRYIHTWQTLDRVSRDPGKSGVQNTTSATARLEAFRQELEARKLPVPNEYEARVKAEPGAGLAKTSLSGAAPRVREIWERVPNMSADELEAEFAKVERRMANGGDRNDMEIHRILDLEGRERGLWGVEDAERSGMLDDPMPPQATGGFLAPEAAKFIGQHALQAGAGGYLGYKMDNSEDGDRTDGMVAGAVAGAFGKPLYKAGRRGAQFAGDVGNVVNDKILDPVNDLVSKPTRALWERILVPAKDATADWTHRHFPKAGRWLFTQHGQGKRYLDAKESMTRELAEGKMVAEDTWERVKGYSTAVSEILSRAADGGWNEQQIIRALSGQDIDAGEAARAVQDVHSIFRGLGEDLVKLNKLPQSSLDKYTGRYLPRIPATAAEAAPKSPFAKPKDGGIRFDDEALGRLKKRQDKLSPEAEARMSKDFGARAVTGILQESQLAATERFFQTVRGMGEVTHQKYAEVSAMLVDAKKYRAAALKENDAEAALAAGKRVQEYHKQLRELTAGMEKAGFKQLPKDKRLGSLSGQFVKRANWDDIAGMAQAPAVYGELMDGYDKWLRRWKAGKTILNPATHGRNIIGSQFLSWLGGGPTPFSKTYREAWRTIDSKSGTYYQEARKHGIMDSTFASEELGKMGKRAGQEGELSRGLKSAGAEIAAKFQGKKSPRAERVEAEAKTTADVAAAKALEGMQDITGRGKTLAGRGFDKAANMYHKEDLAARLSHYIHLREKGVDAAEAARQAKHWVPTFTDLSQATKSWARVVPFFSYTAAALPRVAEAAAKNPVRFAMVGGMAYALQETAFEQDVPEEILPANMRSLTGEKYNPLPKFVPVSEDEHGQRKYLDFTYIMPWGDLGENQGVGNSPLDRLPGQFNPLSNPMIAAIAQVGLGKDRLTGREMYSPSMDGSETTGVTLDYLYKQALPSLAPGIPGTSIKGGWGAQKLANAGALPWQDAKLDIHSQAPRHLGAAIADAVIGIKQKQIDPSRELEYRYLEYDRELSDLDDRWRRVQDDRYLTEEERERQLAEFRRKESRIFSNMDRLDAAANRAGL